MSEPESSSLTSEGDASELESLRNFSQVTVRWHSQVVNSQVAVLGRVRCILQHQLQCLHLYHQNARQIDQSVGVTSMCLWLPSC